MENTTIMTCKVFRCKQDKQAGTIIVMIQSSVTKKVRKTNQIHVILSFMNADNEEISNTRRGNGKFWPQTNEI